MDCGADTESAIYRELPAMAFNDVVRNVELEAVSQLAFQRIEGGAATVFAVETGAYRRELARQITTDER